MRAQLIIAGPACSECSGPTELYCYPHQYAGLWECLDPECGTSDTHEHDDIIAEVVEVDYMRQGEHDTYNTTVDVCATCGIQVEV
jgi:hypothetical protein